MLSVSPNDQPERDLRRQRGAQIRLQSRNLAYEQQGLAERAAEIISSAVLGDADSARKAREDFSALSAEVVEWTLKAADNARALAQIPNNEED